MDKVEGLLNAPLDVSEYFYSLQNDYYLAGRVKTFDAATAEGSVGDDTIYPLETIYSHAECALSGKSGINQQFTITTFTETKAI